MSLPILTPERDSGVPRRRRRVDPIEAAIGNRLREIRKSRGITQVELAEQLGVNQSVLSECERGDVRLHGALVVRIAKALKVSADELLGLSRAEERRSRNGRLLRRLQRIETLPRSKQRVVLEMIDAFLEKHEKTART
jgi:transcriptional regulator with XRE-family HTH domain